MDQAVFYLINQRWTHPALDLFMAAISDVEIWKPMIVALVVYALIFRGFKGRAFVFCVLFTLALSETLAVNTLKSAVARKRPKQVQPVRMVELQKASPKFLTLFKTPRIHQSDQRGARKRGKSFPSGHVANNTVIAICCVLFFGPWGWLYFVVVAAIGWSRIYLGAHWPSDVLATVFMAAGGTMLVLALLEMLWKWAAARWTPEMFARHPSLIGNVAHVSNLHAFDGQVENLRHK